MSDPAVDDTASSERRAAELSHEPRHSVLTPEGQIESAGAFGRGLGHRYGSARVRRMVGRVALGTALLIVVLAVGAAIA